MRTRMQRAGDAAEALVVERLVASGWTILARNLHVGRTELDVLAVDPGPPRALVVVEVRWRRVRSFGLPEETVDRRKERRLREAGLRLAGAAARGGDALRAGDLVLPRLPLRLDLVAVEPPLRRGGEPRIRHHRAALG